MPVETELRAVAGPPRQAAKSAVADAIAIPVRATPDGPVAESGEFDDLLSVGAGALLAHHEAKGEPGEVTAVPVTFGDGLADLVFFGVGDASPAALRRAGAALARRCRGRKNLVVVPPEAVGDAGLAAFAEGAQLASYSFRVVTGDGAKRPPRGITIVTGDDRALDRSRAIAGAAGLARDLANTPSLEKSPAWLAGQATEVAERGGLTVRVHTERELREQGFGGLLAVGAGSTRPPRLIELTYQPAVPAAARPTAPGEHGGHIVLIGKGITFDSGGLSLKPNANMKLMKTDMAGGAVVIAVLGALRELGVRCKVTGLVAAAENMPSGSAMRPSDVIRHYGGRTSEVLNTDAEGRLVLADALAYADAQLSPDTMVDVATLTGAAKVALGLRYGALYATDGALASALTAAGEASGERLWQMPLTEEYRPWLDSDVADIANIGRGGKGGGSITAALFLREFVGDRRWAHLDIAGPARAGSDDGEITKGATGFGVRVLLRWLTELR